MSSDLSEKEIRALLIKQRHEEKVKFSAMKIGQGHGGNTPNLPAIRETLREHMTPIQLDLLDQLQPGTRVFRMGKAKIFVSPPHEDLGWHMSISRDDHYPSWDEVAKAWYELVPESEQRTGAMILPPKDQYVNIHNFCFQIHEVENE